MNFYFNDTKVLQVIRRQSQSIMDQFSLAPLNLLLFKSNSTHLYNRHRPNPPIENGSSKTRVSD